MKYTTFSGTYETANGSTVEFEFPAIDFDAMLADLQDAYGEGRVYGVRTK
jgi:hypothetical protein